MAVAAGGGWYRVRPSAGLEKPGGGFVVLPPLLLTGCVTDMGGEGMGIGEETGRSGMGGKGVDCSWLFMMMIEARPQSLLCLDFQYIYFIVAVFEPNYSCI